MSADAADVRVRNANLTLHEHVKPERTPPPPGAEGTWHRTRPTDGNDGQQQEPRRDGGGVHTF